MAAKVLATRGGDRRAMARSDFGDQLRVRRRAAGLSQRELASIAGMSPATVRDLEQGRTRYPSPRSVRTLIHALSLTGPAAEALRRSAGTPATPGTGAAAGALRVAVLGPVTVRRGSAEVRVGGVRRRTVLGRLVLGAPGTVPAADLIEAVWGADAPGSSAAVLHTHVSRLRSVLTAAEDELAADRLRHGAGGYRLSLSDAELDLAEFRRLVRQASQTADDALGLDLLEAALALWRGEAFADLPQLHDHVLVRALAQERIDAALSQASLALRLSRPARSLPILLALADANPLHELLHAHLVRLLAAAGRQTEALATFDEMRRRLAEELGVGPSAELAAAHLSLLRQEPADGRSPAHAGDFDRPTPSQLPPAIAPFVGRQAELRRLHHHVARAGQCGTTRVVAITGTAGVGKTTLAVNWAHRVADRFPDGQLFVDMRGFDSGRAVVDPAEAIRRFLDALGVAADRMPAEAADRTSLYRSLLAGRRVLVVVDNAIDAGQVRPLLPGAAGCLVVVTSRHRLAGLVATEGARPLALDLFSEAESRQLLAGRVGAGPVAAAPAAVSTIIAACVRLPLALAIAAARMTTDPELGLDGLAEQLTDAMGRLDALTVPDAAADIRAVLLGSYRALPPSVARMFRLLGLHPGAHVALSTAASLAGVPVEEAGSQLAALVDGHLLTRFGDRYSLHDVLRAFAVELTRDRDPLAHRRAAEQRLLDHYVRAGFAAARLLQPHRPAIELPPPVDGVTCPDIVDAERASAWLAAECAAMVAAVRGIAATAFPGHVHGLAWTLTTFLEHRELWDESTAVSRATLDAARQACDPGGQVFALAELTNMAIRRGRYDDAVRYAAEAVELSAGVGDATCARALLHLAWALDKQGKPREALDHSHRALEIYGSLGQASGRAHALNGAGWCHGQLGDHNRMLAQCTEALEIYRMLDNERGEAAALDSIGRAHHHLGDHAAAVRHYLLALEIDDRLRDRYNEAETSVHLAETYEAAAQPTKACEAWQRALRLLDAVQHPSAGAVAARLRELAAAH